MRTLWLIFFTSLAGAVQAERLVYEMSAFGIKFGTMTVEHKHLNDSTEQYTLHAKGYLKVLWMERNDESIYEVRYVHQQLRYSSFRQIESGVVKRWNRVMGNGKQYTVESSEGNRVFNEPPLFSVLKMYFQSPKNISRVFHEAEAGYTTLFHKNDNTVEIKSADGGRGVYFYTKEKLTHMEFHISIATVYMKLIN